MKHDTSQDTPFTQDDGQVISLIKQELKLSQHTVSSQLRTRLLPLVFTDVRRTMLTYSKIIHRSTITFMMHPLDAVHLFKDNA